MATAGAGGGGASGEAGAGGSGGAVALSDGQILKITDTANLGEIEQGEIASEKAEVPDVQAYAEMMVTEHTVALEKGDMLAKSEDISLEPHPIAAALQAKSDAIVMTLTETPPPEFDLVYMQAQLELHASLLMMLEETLIPEADTPEVEAYLTELRGSVAEHLEMAEQIVETLE